MEENIKEKKGFKKWWFGTNEVFRGLICGLVGLILFTSIALPVGLSVSKQVNVHNPELKVVHFLPAWHDEEEEYKDLKVMGTFKLEKDKNYYIEMDLAQYDSQPLKFLHDTNWTFMTTPGDSFGQKYIYNTFGIMDIKDIKVNDTSLTFLGVHEDDVENLQPGQYYGVKVLNDYVDATYGFFNIENLITNEKAKIRIDFTAKDNGIVFFNLFNYSAF